ncbi:MAG: hypothetical protein JKX76_01115 [Colwellia sp.]|nr:hypothetical protein [Colwellia sp.]
MYYSAPSFLRINKNTTNEKVSITYATLFSLLLCVSIVVGGYFGYTWYQGSQPFNIFKQTKKVEPITTAGNAIAGQSVDERFYTL